MIRLSQRSVIESLDKSQRSQNEKSKWLSRAQLA